MIRSFAKINLTLDVFSRRADGYHAIASVMQAISLHDQLSVTPADRPGVTLTCDGSASEGVPVDETNLAVRAAKAVLAHGGATNGVSIHLHKVIPAQAGLGGGSSNAAAALVGVNRALDLGIPAEKLEVIAGSLGSDVPYFLSGGTASARGRGERITRHPDAPEFWMVLVKPDLNISTASAYAELDAIPERASNRGTAKMELAIADRDLEMIASRAGNDFEAAVFSHSPKLAWLHDEMVMAGARTARLCGSGSALFGIARSEADAERAAGLLRKSYGQVFTARTLTRAESQEWLGLAEPGNGHTR